MTTRVLDAASPTVEGPQTRAGTSSPSNSCRAEAVTLVA